MKRPIIVGLGEILWDVFPDGPRFGGAPCNFSCSTAELAQDTAQVYVVSAVGNDELGERALASLVQHQVNTSSVQRNERETGKVLVELDASGVASYRFAEDTAWDRLAWTENLQQLAATCDIVCFGTLGQRSVDSRSTIQRFVAATRPQALRILDVNLRWPFVNDDVIRESLRQANILKFNDDELPYLAHLSGARGSDLEVLTQLARHYQLRCVALTRAARGAVIVAGDVVSDRPGVAVNIVDTVGAGDAYTAAMTFGLLADRPLDEINQAAIATAAFVCSQPGATMSFPASLRARTAGVRN